MSLKVIFKHAYLRTFCSKTSDSHIIAIHQACKDLLIIKVKKKKCINFQFEYNPFLTTTIIAYWAITLSFVFIIQ